MKNEIQGIRETVENAAEKMRRISALCNMLSGLGDSKSNIPEESLCCTMALIQDLLSEQVEVLDTISWPAGKVVAA